MAIAQLSRGSAAVSYTGKLGLDSANSVKINVRDFTKLPGPGRRVDGPYSGEQFREERLLEAYRQAKASKKTLVVDLDDTAGYGPSFVREAFGGLVRETKDKGIKQRLAIISKDDPLVLKRILGWIDEEIAKLD